MVISDRSICYIVGLFILKILLVLKAVFVPTILIQVLKYFAYYMYLPLLHFK